tara:strand:+ start:237 stop:404 length:168 start_codon:yes stop_codon:yes gene_type:complete
MTQKDFDNLKKIAIKERGKERFEMLENMLIKQPENIIDNKETICPVCKANTCCMD